jgi:glycerol-3-phosphate O-acyltransferase
VVAEQTPQPSLVAAMDRSHDLVGHTGLGHGGEPTPWAGQVLADEAARSGRCTASAGRLFPLHRAAPMLVPDREGVGMELIHDQGFRTALDALAVQLGRDPAAVRAEAAGYLQEMAASHNPRAAGPWQRFSRWVMRAHDLLVDEDQLARLRLLDRKHSLALVFSHRSYLDGWVLPNVLATHGFSPTFTFGGGNLDLPGIGWLASNTGVIFIRRSTGDLPVYRLTLRTYIEHLVRQRRNVTWSIEGGRTRTGKLRPPALGILRYLTDAAERVAGPDVLLVPVSVVYDQLHEVAAMTAEARGARKHPEDLRWLVNFIRSQRDRLGRAYLSVGEPIPLRQRAGEVRAADGEGAPVIERIAIEACHRINRATPVTVTAVVSLAMLGADRALTLDGVLATIEPLARYIEVRDWTVAGAAVLTDRSTIRRALAELVSSGVLTCYDGGTEPVWGIGADQHLVAAFYRNGAIHIFVERAIGEVALLAAAEAGADDATLVAWEEAKRLRDLLKFEFFFPGRHDFEAELRTELAILTPAASAGLTPADARRLLAGARPHLAHLVLRPFLDAYHVVADRLAAAEDDTVEEEELLAEALRVGRQWELQRRIASAESVSLELFRTAIRLAAHRDLLACRAEEPAGSLAGRRRVFAAELQDTVQRIGVIAQFARDAGTAGQPAGAAGAAGGS